MDVDLIFYKFMLTSNIISERRKQLLERPRLGGSVTVEAEAAFFGVNDIHVREEPLMLNDAKKELLKAQLESGRRIIDCHAHVGVSQDNYLSYAYPYAMSFEDLAIRMALLGIDHSVVFPFISSFYERFDPERQPKHSRFPYERENLNLFKEIYDIFPEHAERAIPFAMFDPENRVEEQVALLEAIDAEHPVMGLKTVTSYNRVHAAAIAREGRPLLDFARRRNIPLLFHCSYLKTDVWASAFDIMDVVEANPDARFCLAHSARFIKSVLDRAAKAPNCFVDLSAFDIHCQLATSWPEPVVAPPGERFPADYSQPASVMRDLAEAYPDTMIWGTDTPYNYFIQNFTDVEGKVHDIRLKSGHTREMEILKALPPDMVERIAHRNTLRFLFG